MSSSFRSAVLAVDQVDVESLSPVTVGQVDALDLRAAALAARVDAELDRVDGLLFTATPREDLLGVARFARVADSAWVALVRQIVALTHRMSVQERDFAGDEVALALGVSPTTGRLRVWQAGSLAALPGLLEAVDVGRIGQGHALACLRVLDDSSLEWEQRQAVVLIALARYTDQTPGDWGRLIKRLVLSVDVHAFAARKAERTAERRVVFYPLPDEQAAMTLTAPLEQVAAVEARISAEAARRKAAGDPRTMDQLRTDVSLELLTGGRLDGADPAPWSVTVVVPLSVLEGEDSEVGELPGWGPVLPSTARDLAAQAATHTEVGVDVSDGHVVGVTTPQPNPVAGTDPLEHGHAGQPCVLALVRAARERARTLDRTVPTSTWAGYRTTDRLRRYLEARDRTCTFPGCHQPAARTDKDHLIPWPAGPTTATNTHCLCRRHHRAKHAIFTVQRHPDGTTAWTTRGGWIFHRSPRGY